MIWPCHQNHELTRLQMRYENTVRVYQYSVLKLRSTLRIGEVVQSFPSHSLAVIFMPLEQIFSPKHFHIFPIRSLHNRLGPCGLEKRPWKGGNGSNLSATLGCPLAQAGGGGEGQRLAISVPRLNLFTVSPRFKRNGLTRSIGESVSSSAVDGTGRRAIVAPSWCLSRWVSIFV